MTENDIIKCGNTQMTIIQLVLDINLVEIIMKYIRCIFTEH